MNRMIGWLPAFPKFLELLGFCGCSRLGRARGRETFLAGATVSDGDPKCRDRYDTNWLMLR